MNKRILITGGCGFVGHHVVQHYLTNFKNYELIILDSLSYASEGLQRLKEIGCLYNKQIKIITHDFTIPLSVGIKKEIGEVDCILHIGAETHVDNSIENPRPFIMSNVVGTMNMLEFAREQSNLESFLYFSTDEVFGAAPVGTFYKEWDRYNSGNPYSASKAAGEELCLAYHNTYNVPVIISHTMNIFGERQHYEKFIPLVMGKVLKGETIKIHSNKDKTKSGTRFYIHARNVAKAVDFIIENGTVGEKYNIVGEREVSNLEMAQIIADTMNKPLKYEMVDFHSKRPGHDLRYALDGEIMKNMGWEIPVSFKQSLEKTIHWSIKNPHWLSI